MTDKVEKIDTSALQGIVLNPYGDLPCAAYCLLEIKHVGPFQHWLKAIIPLITKGDEAKPEFAVNIAFTYGAINKIRPGLKVGTFSEAFEDGMVSDYRSRILGDSGPNAPQHWLWGGTDANSQENATHVDIFADAFRQDFTCCRFTLTADSWRNIWCRWFAFIGGSGAY